MFQKRRPKGDGYSAAATISIGARRLKARFDTGRTALPQTLAQVSHNLFDRRRVRARKNKKIFRTLPGSRENNQVFREEFRFVRDHRAAELDCLGKWPPGFARDKEKFVRLFIGCDQRAEKICRNPASAAADAGRGPGDRFTQDVLSCKNVLQSRRQSNRQLYRHVEIGRAIQFFKGEPGFRFHGAQNLRRKIEERCGGNGEDRQCEDGIVMNQRESAQDGDIFANTESDVRKRLGRCIAGESRRRFRRVCDQTGSAREQGHDNGKRRAGMSEHLDREQRAANRSNYSVDNVPCGIDPRNFVREKFEEIKNASNDNYGGMAKHFERLIGGPERDPMKMNCQTGGENGEIKIDSGETSKPERDAEKVQPIHMKIMRRGD